MANYADSDDDSRQSQAPGTTRESREQQIIASAYDLAEKQLHEGSASSQVITHFLKMGSPREVAERERLANENELLKARVRSLEEGSRFEELAEAAIAAMSTYKGMSNG